MEISGKRLVFSGLSGTAPESSANSKLPASRGPVSILDILNLIGRFFKSGIETKHFPSRG